MSMKVHAIGRTARIVKPYAVEQRNGKNGTFESRMVMFSLATDRNYRQATTNADGTVTQERHTDFFVCKATGPVADRFAKYCSAMKKDENGNDKLVSRRIAIEGHLEKYNATRTEQVQLNNGQIIQVSLPEEREVVVVEEIEFLDANPSKSNTGATATIVQAQPVTNVQPTQTVAPVAGDVTVAPAPATTPVAPVAAPVPTAPVVAPVAGDVSNEVAPF
jgi:hypothetical protein